MKAKTGGRGTVRLMFIIILVLVLRAALFGRNPHFSDLETEGQGG